MLTHLVKMIRFAPLFPIVGRGRSLLQPVDVRDVAQAIRATLEGPSTAGRTYDVVGPRRLTLEDVVRTVARGLRLPLWILPVPLGVQRLAVRAMDAVTSRPLSTPAQLQMLADGLVGDPCPARADLGLAPRPFDAARVETLAAAIPSLFGFSLRLVDGPAAREWLGRRRVSLWRTLALAAGGTLLIAALSPLVGNLWYRLAVAYAVLIPAVLASASIGWAELFRPALRHLVQGVAAAVVLYVATAITLALVPVLNDEVVSVAAWKTALPSALVLPLLVFIVLGEEVVWRGAVALPLAARFGPWIGALLGAGAFGMAHVPLGRPVVVAAALVLGAVWGALAVRTRSLVPSLLCHLLWDLAVLARLPG
jgi:membrane protease YdiL (CAAX protease family)